MPGSVIAERVKMAWISPRIALAVGFAVLMLTGSSAAGDGDGRSPVVLELFTSQGCSSCPPADELLSRLGRETLPDGIEVIPLSFHVDYWNYIGWTDPFSSEEWSERQRRYARALRLDTIYTPQIFIHGAAQVVGARTEEVLTEIARASARNNAVDIDIRLERADQGKLNVQLATRVVGELPAGGLDLMVALFEERLVTAVESGENARRTLENDYVVRVLRRGFGIDGDPGSTRAGTEAFELATDWTIPRLGVAAFAQDATTLRIHGAARRSLADVRP